MTEEELQLAAFEIILHSGTARTSVHEAFAAMKEGKYDEAKEKLDAADAEFWKHIMLKLICYRNMQAVPKLKSRLLWFTHKII